MPSDQNIPVTPKRRPRRAAATTAAGRLSGISNEMRSPPPKRRRPLGARNDSSDFEMQEESDDDVMDIDSSPPVQTSKTNSKDNPFTLDSSPPVRPPGRVTKPRPTNTGSTAVSKPATAKVILEMRNSSALQPGSSSNRKSSSSSNRKSTPTQPTPGPSAFKTSVPQPSTSGGTAQLKTRRNRKSDSKFKEETDYIDHTMIKKFWIDAIDRGAHKVCKELSKKD
ncbi:hypothetical protein FRC11_012789 [Ceratobasidium sp. 423]|nr:hypothetical protein FRC11_012789 [Ceratobasidium sp. 423]